MIEEFLILIQFMTRIPVFIKIKYDEEKLGKAIKYFPLVGLIIGIFLWGISIFAGKITENRLLTGMLIIIGETAITGLIHVDGLADTFDGLFSYASKERMLEIMKDSRIGTNGAVVLILYFMAKVILLSEVKSEYILLYPVISRLSTSVNAGLGEYARKEGMSNGIIEKNGRAEAIFSIVLSGVISFIILRIKGLIILAVAILFIILFMESVKRKIGGITGDTMGASLELTGVLVLLTGVIIK